MPPAATATARRLATCCSTALPSGHPRASPPKGLRHLRAARFVQGRFKSLIVEPGKHPCDLVGYIHLNPARAKLVAPAAVKSYRWSSLHWLPKTKTRPSRLDTTWLDYRERRTDSASGWRSYATSLQMRLSDHPKEIEVHETTANLPRPANLVVRSYD